MIDPYDIGREPRAARRTGGRADPADERPLDLSQLLLIAAALVVVLWVVASCGELVRVLP